MENNLKKIVFLLVFLQAFAGYGQNALKKYYKYTNKAELAICAENYVQASRFYKKAFARHEPFGKDLSRALLVNYKYTGNSKKALLYAHILAQRNKFYPEDWVTDTLQEQAFYFHLKNIRDTTRMVSIPELQKAIQQIREDDQAVRRQCRDNSDSCRNFILYTDSLNLVRIKALYKQYGFISPARAGSVSGLYMSLLHNCQLRYQDPHEILIRDVMLGHYDARDYMSLEDRCWCEVLDPLAGKPYKGYFGTNVYHATIVHNTLFVYEPINVKEVNRNRRKIHVYEKWEEYLVKLLFTFNEINPDFNLVPLQSFSFGSEENNKKEELSRIKEIEEGSVQGTYYTRLKKTK